MSGWCGAGWGCCISAGFARPPNSIADLGRVKSVVEVGGGWGVEDGDGAAAFFGGRVGGFHGRDELAEGVEAGVGEVGCVGGWGGGHGRAPGREGKKFKFENFKFQV